MKNKQFFYFQVYYNINILIIKLIDANIVEEKFLEDINNLLNIGEIPKLYTVDEKENVKQIII